MGKRLAPWVLLLGLLAATGNGLADPPAPEVLLRNVFVPAEQPTAWPTDGETYLPIEQQQLDELLKTANQTAGGPTAPHVDQIVMVGSLEGTSAAVGYGAVRIVTDQQPSGWLSLASTTVSFTQGTWRNVANKVWFGVDPATQQLSLRVPQSDWLDFRWRSQSVRLSDGTREFRFGMPPAVAACLVLDLPANLVLEPLPTSGVLVSTVTSDSDLPFDATLAKLPEPLLEGQTRWLLQWGPNSRPVWRVRDSRPVVVAASTTGSYDEQVVYRVNESGISTTKVFDFSSSASLPSQLSIQVPTDLVVRSLRWNSTSLPVARNAEGVVELELPKQAMTDSPRRLSIEAWSPLTTDKTVALPQIALPGLFWQSGQIDLRLASSLRLENLQLQSVVQLPPPTGVNTQQLSFAKLDSAAGISLALTRRLANSSIRIGRSIQLGLVATTAVCTTEFTRQGTPPVQVLVADLIDDWQPSVVSVDAPFEITDWYVKGADGNRQLVVRLLQIGELSATDNQTVRLTVEASRPVIASSGWAPIEEFDVLRWHNATATTSLMAFEVKDGYRLEMNPMPTPLSEEEITPYLGTLLPASLTSAIYDRATFADSLQGYLTPAVAELDAVVVTTVLDVAEQWRVGHRVICTPRSGSLGALYVRLNDAAEAPPRWRVEGETTWRIAERNEGIRRNATWVLELPRRQAGTFAIEVEPHVFPGLVCTPSPLQLMGEGQREHWLEVRSDRVRTLRVSADGWIPSSQSWPGEYPLHSSWQLKAENEIDSRFAVTHSTPRSLPLATINQAHLSTTLAPAVASQHRLELTIQNQAERQVQCEVPAAATNIHWHAVTEESESSLVLKKVSTPRFELPLSAEPGIERFVVEFTLPIKLVHGAQVPMPSLSFSLPVSETTWTVEYPHTYQLVDGRTYGAMTAWNQRLFGPLASAYWRTGGRAASHEPHPAMQETVVPLGASRQAKLLFQNRATTRSAHYWILAVAALVGYWLWGRTTLLVLGLTLSAALALLLPAPDFVWATSLWGGLLLAVAVRSLMFASRLRRQSPEGEPQGSFAMPVAGAVLLLFAMLPTGAHAAEPTPAGAAEPVVESILIPMDQQGQTVGDTRYVSGKLLAELLRRKQQASAAEPWLIAAPRYTGCWCNNDQTEMSAPQRRWELQFDLEVLEPNAVVQLPLQLNDAKWDTTLRLDGVPVSVTWNAAGDRLSFAVPRKGRYLARLGFEPKITRTAADIQMQLQVLALPGSLLRLTVPPQTKELLVNGAKLSGVNGTNEEFELPLPMGNQLTIASQSKESGSVAPLQLVCWEWLSLTPAEFTLDCVCALDDGDWNGALPPRVLVGGKPVAVGDQATDNAQWHLVGEPTLAEQPRGAALVRFRLARTRSGVFGRMQLPSPTLTGTSTLARHLAVSHPTDLSVTMAGASATDSQLIDQFQLFWPDAESANSVATITTARRSLEVTIRPSNSATLVEESLDIGCYDDHLQVDYRGAISVGQWSPYFHTFTLSDDLQVEQVLLTVGGETQAVAYSRPNPTSLLVRFDEMPATNYQLQIKGSVAIATPPPSSRAKVCDIPQLTTSGDTTARQRIALYAADNLTAKVVGSEVESTRSDRLPAPPEGWSGYAVAQFSAAADRVKPLQVEIRGNRPRFDAAVLSTFARQNSSWVAEIGLLLDVKQGVLPEVVLDWPEPLVGRVETSDTYQVTVEPATNGNRRQLRIRLPQAIGPQQRQRITLRTTLDFETRDRLQFPVLTVQDVNQTQLYFGLVRNDRGEWSWQDATETVAPAGIEGLLASWPAAKLIKATGPSLPTLVWTSATNGAQAPQLPLVRVSVAPGDGDAITLTTRWVVPAWGESSLGLRMAAEREAVTVRVDGVPANVTPAGDRQLSVLLPDPGIPHLVELVSVASRRELATGIETAQLVVGDTVAEVDHRVWHVDLPGHQFMVARQTAEAMPTADVAALELTQLLAAASVSSRKEPQHYSTSWAEAWLTELSEAESTFRQAIRQQPADPAIVQPAEQTEYADLLLRVQNEMARVRKLAGTPVDLASAPLPGDSLPDAPLPSQQFVQSVPTPLQLVTLNNTSGDDWLRWTLALVAVAIAAVHVAARRGGRYPQLPTDLGYPMLFFTAVVLGLVWWLCLWPRAVGLVIAVLAVVAWLRWNRFAGASSH